jgi:hypothetical protein
VLAQRLRLRQAKLGGRVAGGGRRRRRVLVLLLLPLLLALLGEQRACAEPYADARGDP